jgi:16S rRNA (cytosine967-C5)-methyltransferase
MKLFSPLRPAKAGGHKAGLGARDLAVALLVAVLQSKRPLDDAFTQLSAAAAFATVEPRDRAFARAIALASLRRRGQIRAVLGQFITAPPQDPKGALDEIMLAAGAQLLFMGAPAHAVIDLTVDQIKADAQARRFAKLGNAVLRRVAGEGPALVAAQDAEALNTPEWLWRRWLAAYGEDVTRASPSGTCRRPRSISPWGTTRRTGRGGSAGSFCPRVQCG